MPVLNSFDSSIISPLAVFFLWWVNGVLGMSRAAANLFASRSCRELGVLL